MKKALLITMTLVLIAIPAAGQEGGYLGLFADQLGENCALFDSGAPYLTFYVIHMDAPNGGSAAQYAIDYSGAPELSVFAESHLGVPIGNTEEGLSLGYGGCFQSPVVISTIVLNALGNSAPCSILRIIPDPNNIVPDEIQVTDCDLNLINVVGASLLINPDASCPDCGLLPVATEIDTWGSLKSLYR